MIKIDKNLDVLVIVGPTSVGKSALAIELAQKYNGEIISGDAYQVYKKMDIGTAKVTKHEQSQAVHHLIDIIDYKQEYNVHKFQEQARCLIEDIKARGKLPIIAGGTGLYVQSVLYNYEFKEIDGFKELKVKNEKKTKEELQAYIKMNHVELNNSDINNHKRLSVIVTKHMLGMPLANDGYKKFYDNVQIIGLTADRHELYQRIDQRVDQMINQGLVKEVEQFESNHYSQLAIGYKEIHQYLSSELTYEQAVELIKKNSRNFAKRQYTWYRNKIKEITWYQKEGDTWQLIKD